MSLLLETSKNNLLLSLRGVTFTNPFIRKAFGQAPDSVDVVELYKKNLGKQLKKIIHEKGEPFIVVVKNDEQSIEDVFLVPFEKRGGELKVSSPFHISL